MRLKLDLFQGVVLARFGKRWVARASDPRYIERETGSVLDRCWRDAPRRAAALVKLPVEVILAGTLSHLEQGHPDRDVRLACALQRQPERMLQWIPSILCCFHQTAKQL